MSYKNYTDLQLLKAYHLVLEELRGRELVRSSNSPAGDYAEYLVCKALKLKPQTNSTAGYDAVDKQGIRYQVKARRSLRSRQLGAIRNLKDKNFDFLIGIIFNPDFTVKKAIKIPHHVIVKNHRFSAHTNSALFMLRDSVWQIKGVQDIAKKIAAVQNRN